MLRKVWLFLWVLGAAGSAAAAPPPAILVMGDSLSAAYGIPLQAGWVSLMEQRLRSEGYPHRVINGSVSGETTAGGLARLPAVLAAEKPALVLIELGGNDGLRGLPVKALRANLAQMVRLARAAGAQVAVFEMWLPANYGPAYIEKFRAAFGEVAREERATLVPFFLGKVAQQRQSFQEDGIHPTAAVQPDLLEAVWPAVKPLLVSRSPPRSAAADARASP